MLSNPRTLYGLHSASPYNRTSGLPYGILKVLEGSSLNVSGKLVTLMGGSNKYPWAVESGESQADVDLKVNEYPSFLFQLLYGATPTETGSSATGSVSSPVNVSGTSVVAATGIASLEVTPTTGAASLKFGKYWIKATDSTHVDVYASTDIDMGRGSAGSFQDDTLKITATPLTITEAGTVDVPNFGITITGGASAIALVAGDTAVFEVLPPSNKSMSVVIGSVSQVPPEFGMIAMGQKSGSLEITELDIFRMKGTGLPLGLQPNAFAKADVKLQAFYDSAKDGVFKERWVQESS